MYCVLCVCVRVWCEKERKKKAEMPARKWKEKKRKKKKEIKNWTTFRPIEAFFRSEIIKKIKINEQSVCCNVWELKKQLLFSSGCLLLEVRAASELQRLPEPICPRGRGLACTLSLSWFFCLVSV